MTSLPTVNGVQDGIEAAKLLCKELFARGAELQQQGGRLIARAEQIGGWLAKVGEAEEIVRLCELAAKALSGEIESGPMTSNDRDRYRPFNPNPIDF